MSSIWKWLNQGTWIGRKSKGVQILGYTIKNPYCFKISRLFWGMELLLVVVFVMANEYMWAAVFAIFGIVVAFLVDRAKKKE